MPVSLVLLMFLILWSTFEMGAFVSVEWGTTCFEDPLFRGPLPPLGHLGPSGVMVKAMNCGIVVREFVLQSRYYVHFRANTLGKGMNPLILPPAMGK